MIYYNLQVDGDKTESMIVNRLRKLVTKIQIPRFKNNLNERHQSEIYQHTSPTKSIFSISKLLKSKKISKCYDKASRAPRPEHYSISYKEGFI